MSGPGLVASQSSTLDFLQAESKTRKRKGWRIEQLGAKMAADAAKSRELLHRHKLSSTQDVTLSLTPQEASSSYTVTLADSIME